MSESKSAEPNESLWLIAGIVICVVAGLASLVCKSRIKVYSLSRFLLPLFVVAEFAIFALDAEQSPVEVFAIGCAWMYFRIHYFMTWRLAMLRSDLPPFCIAVIGQSLLTVGCVVGWVACTLADQTGLSDFIQLAGLCVVTAVASALLFDTRYISMLEGTPMPAFDPANESMCSWCVDRATELYGFTRQERSVSLMLVRGYDNPQILEELTVTPGTLKTHLRNMYRKTDVHSREELILLLRSLSTKTAR